MLVDILLTYLVLAFLWGLFAVYMQSKWYGKDYFVCFVSNFVLFPYCFFLYLKDTFGK